MRYDWGIANSMETFSRRYTRAGVQHFAGSREDTLISYIRESYECRWNSLSKDMWESPGFIPCESARSATLFEK